jgi:ubiquitin-conjugating enzyme E2 Z
MTTFISKDTFQRLLKDVRYLIKNPLTEQGIYYIHDDSDMMKGYAMIIGPSETPYFGGFYFFEFTYPIDYPHSPPKVNYYTNGNKIRFNPNLYTCGKVCISLLNTWRGEQWTSCQTISTVLLTLCTLLCSNPLLNEPGVTKNHHDIEPYNEIIEYSNIDIAICDIVSKKKDIYMPFFENFYPYIKENFNKNYDKLIEFTKKKIDKIQNPKNFVTSYYNMNVYINYSFILEKLNLTKEICN